MSNRLARCFAVLALLCAAADARSAPTGEQVVFGNVSFDRDGGVTVIHASDGAVIHYDSFDIFANEVVQFIQPSDQARVLNQVFGDMTRIEGTLLANGIVYIVNPAGIFLDGNAVVRVGGLVAAAGHISEEDFRAGVDRFELTGPLVNAGGSILGDQVALLGRTVENHGSIAAPDGTIALVAGDRAVLLRHGGRVAVQVDGPPETRFDEGVLQAGSVDAGGGQVIFAVGDHYSLAINHQGVTRGSDVELRGGAEGLLLVQGGIDASGDEGGSIRVLGDRVALIGASLDASGATGGGDIRVGGDLHGGGDLPTARRTYVDGQSVLRADATQSGDGGRVIVWGDEAAVMAGTISARGGVRGGDGGFAEISSRGALEASGDVDLTAPAGATGTLLFDPQDIVIRGGSADGSDVPDAQDDTLVVGAGTPGEVLFGDIGSADPFEIYESEIEGTNANIVLEAQNSISASGTFDHQAVGEGVGVLVVGADNDLTLRTRNDVDDELGSAMTPGIDLGALELRTSGSGHIALTTGDDGAGGGGTGAAAGITVGNLVTGGGTVDVTTQNGSISVGDVDASGGDGDTGSAGGGVRIAALLSGDVDTGAIASVGGVGLTGDGGLGGRVSVATADGSVVVASVDASGGQGATRGGNAGLPANPFLPPQILIQAGDADGSGGSSIVVGGDLVAHGGEGLSDIGGRGGRIEVITVAMPVVPPVDPPPPPVGGGPISIGGDIDTTGGDGTLGGAGGNVTLSSAVAGTLDVGDVTARGGNGSMDGGVGASIRLVTQDGSITAGALDASGGDGVDPGARGAAGGVTVLAGTIGSGDITLSGAVRSVDGAGAGAPLASTQGVFLRAAGDIAFVGVPGPQIQSSEFVALQAGGSIGGVGDPVQIDAVHVPTDTLSSVRVLAIEAGDVARVDVVNGAFNSIRVDAVAPVADIDVTQAVADPSHPGCMAVACTPVAIDIDGAPGTSTVVQADTRDRSVDGGVFVLIALRDDLDGVDDVPLQLVVGSGAILGGGSVALGSEDDVVLADGAIAIRPPDERLFGIDAGSLQIRADTDLDGTGAILASGTGSAVDMNTDGANATGVLVLEAATGIGTAANPIQVVNAGRLAAGVTDSGDIRIHQLSGGDLVLSGGMIANPPIQSPGDPGIIFSRSDAVAINAGGGDIDITNDGGDIDVLGTVRATPLPALPMDPNDPIDPIVQGPGSVTLGVTDPGAVIRFLDSRGDPGFRTTGSLVAAGGDVNLDGPAVLVFDTNVIAGGDVDFNGTLDGDAPSLVTRNLSVTADGVVRFGGDVGGGFQLRNLTVAGATQLTQDTAFTVLQSAAFESVDAASQDGAAMSVTAGDEVSFGGDLGAGVDGRLSGLTLDSDRIVFDAAGDQHVETGAGGIALDPGGLPAPPTLVGIGKVGGDLTLETLGTLDVGPNQKLTVEGTANLIGDTVIVGDVNAQEIQVTSTSGVFRIRQRQGGTFEVPGIGEVPDDGTDLVANVIATSHAPQFIGNGAAPDFATLSGQVDGAGAGAAQVVRLNQPVSAGDLVAVDPDTGAVTFYDLGGIGISDVGNETERQPPALPELLPAPPPYAAEGSRQGSGAPPDAEAVLAFLRCTGEAGREASPRSCAASGSALDSERGEELARRYARLFGGSVEAEAARRLMTAQEAGAERDRVLRDTASFLAELRLLGMDAGDYESLRDRLLDAARGGTPRDALLAEVRARGRGLPL